MTGPSAFYPILLCFLLTVNPSFSQTDRVLLLPATTEHVTVRKPFLRQFTDPQHQRSLSGIRQLPANRWTDVNTVNFGSQGSPGWVMFRLQSPVGQTVWLELQSHFIDSIQVWLIRGPGSATESIKAYDPTGFRLLGNDHDAPTQHPFFLKPLYLLPNVAYTVYIRGWVPPGDVLKFDVNLWHPAVFGRYQQRLVMYWAVFAGVVLMSVFVTLVSYVFHPQRIYLYYCGYVLCVSAYALLNDGWGMFLPDSLRWFDNTSRVVHWLIIGLLFQLLFARRFLAIEPKTSGWWLRLNPVLLILLVEAGTFLIDYGVHQKRFNLVTAGYRIGFGMLGLYALLWLGYVIDAFNRGFRPVWLYLASMLVWLFFYAINVFVVNTGWMTNPFPGMLIFRLALLAEIGLIFVGWMYRQRLIRKSAQQLQAQEQTRYRKLLEAERKQQAEELKALRLQNELQQQRERLARDLHDGIGSQLTHIAGRLDILSVRKTAEQPQLVRLGQFTRETNQALRDTVWILNRSEIPFSTFAQRLHTYLLRLWEDIDAPRLDWQTDTMANSSSTNDPILSPLLVQCLFRIAQEAVNNALKYAGATAVCVSLTQQDAVICLIVADNGCGFDTATASNGYGLTNMQKRAEEAGGQWTLTSDSTGTQIHVRMDISH